ncbi:MAG: ribosomal L7Ae/L30e/S12e/Gadd45 family protein [Synergistales bacterium]
MPLSELASGRRVVGVRQVLRKIKMGQLEKLFLARDVAEERVMELLEEAQRQNVAVEWCESMEMLGRAGAISRKATAAGLIKENLKNIE